MEQIKLMQGDCLELMKEIPDGSVDMVLCDLPYGTTRNKWDDVIPFEPLWQQYHRICKRNAAVLLFGQPPFTALEITSNVREFRYEWIYEKTNATGFLNASRMPLKSHESILVFYKSLPTFNPQYVDGAPYRKTGAKRASSNYGKFLQQEVRQYEAKKFPRDVLKISNCSLGADRGSHLTQKPVALLEYLIRTYTNDGETVLDNCMGSGSTGVACVNTGRDFIGMELDPGYFETAKRRIEEAQRQARITEVM